MRNYLHDAKLALPQFVSEAAGELARLKRDLKTALALYNHVCRAGLPGGDDLLAAIRPVFERYQQLGELALAVAGTPPASAYPMMNELLDAISVDDLYYSAVRDLDP
ncbi:MAG: hypothetical protein QUS33_01730 [Dehalococcoidia bacterium]|nr:hypothetical protein [Dehalococcoidia bacterium]